MFVAGMAATLQAWEEDEVPRAAPPRAGPGLGLPRNQLTVSGPGVRMRDETTVLSGGALPPDMPPGVGPPPDMPPGGGPPPDMGPGGAPPPRMPPGGSLATGVTAMEAAVSSVIAGGVVQSHLPDLTGRPLGDLSRCGRARLAAAARRIATPGGDW